MFRLLLYHNTVNRLTLCHQNQFVGDNNDQSPLAMCFFCLLIFLLTGRFIKYAKFSMLNISMRLVGIYSSILSYQIHMHFYEQTIYFSLSLPFFQLFGFFLFVPWNFFTLCAIFAVFFLLWTVKTGHLWVGNQMDFWWKISKVVKLTNIQSKKKQYTPE